MALRGETGNTELLALVDELEDIDLRAAGTGGFAPPGDAARRLQIERRLIGLVVTDVPVEERRRFVRLTCDLSVRVRAGELTSPGVAADIGAGGVFIATALEAHVGDPIEVEIERRPGSLEHSLRVRGKVAWSSDARQGGRPGFGVQFAATDEAAERRVRRFVYELLRKRAQAPAR